MFGRSRDLKCSRVLAQARLFPNTWRADSPVNKTPPGVECWASTHQLLSAQIPPDVAVR